MKANVSIDLMLQEIWRIKDTLWAADGHDVDRLFADRPQTAKAFRPSVVNLQMKRRKA